MREFEYDPEKSKINSEKHGLDFESAQEIWLDSDVLEVPANFTDEPRYLVIGKIESLVCGCYLSRRKNQDNFGPSF